MFRSACGIVLPVFSAVMVLLNLKTILQTDWHRLSMLHWNVPYLLFSGIVSAVIAGVVLALLYRLFPDTVRQLMHRQKLARMVLENQWYEQAERTKQDGFFQGFTQFRYKNEDSPFSTDVLPHGKRAFTFSSGNHDGKISGAAFASGNQAGKRPVLRAGQPRAADGYVEYTLLYDMVANRIPIAKRKPRAGACG